MLFTSGCGQMGSIASETEVSGNLATDITITEESETVDDYNEAEEGNTFHEIISDAFSEIDNMPDNKENEYSFSIISNHGSTSVRGEVQKESYNADAGENIVLDLAPDDGYMYFYHMILNSEEQVIYNSLEKETNDPSLNTEDQVFNIITDEDRNIPEISFKMPEENCVIYVSYCITPERQLRESIEYFEGLYSIDIPDDSTWEDLNNIVDKYDNTSSVSFLNTLKSVAGTLAGTFVLFQNKLFSLFNIDAKPSYAFDIPDPWPETITVNYEPGDSLNYALVGLGSYNTGHFTTTSFGDPDPTNVYCIQPSKAAPPNGSEYRLTGAGTYDGGANQTVKDWFYFMREINEEFAGLPSDENTFRKYIDKNYDGNNPAMVFTVQYSVAHAAISRTPLWWNSDHAGLSAAGEGLLNTLESRYTEGSSISNYKIAAATYEKTGDSGNTYQNMAVFTLNYAPKPKCKVSINKTSELPMLTGSNSAYSLEGAVYGIYADSNCTSEILSMTTDASGYAESDVLPASYLYSTVYVKEKEPSAGFVCDDVIYTATMNPVSAPNTTVVSAGTSIESIDRTGLSFNKIQQLGCTDLSNNPMYSLAGAKYHLQVLEGVNYIDAPFVVARGTIAYSTALDPFITNAEGWLTYTFDYAGSVNDIKRYYSNVIENGGNNYTIVFDEDNPIILSVGYYIIYELEASNGYLRNSTRHNFTVDLTNKIHTYTQEEAPLFDPVSVQIFKYDSETQKKASIGDADLSGAIFQVDYYDAILGYEDIPGHTPIRTWYYATDETGKFTYGDISYEASGYTQSDYYYNTRGDIEFPLGTVTIREIVPPNGYLLVDDASWNGYVTIQGPENSERVEVVTLDKVVYNFEEKAIAWDGNGYVTEKATELSAYDTPTHRTVMSINDASANEEITYINADAIERGDIRFEKVETVSGEPIPNTAFWIEKAYLNDDGTPDLTKSGEKHLIVTDDNGYATTMSGTTLVVNGRNYAVKNADNTNGNDNASEDDIYNNRLVPTGIWFYGVDDYSTLESDPSYAARNFSEERGSLPFDTYYLYEPVSVNNAGRQRIERGDKLFTVFANEQYLTVYPYDSDIPTLMSNSKDDILGNSYSCPSKTMSITDKIYYDKLKFDTTYTVKNILVAREDFTTDAGIEYHAGEAIKDDDGEYITAYTTFTTPATTGHYTYEARGSEDITASFSGESLGNVRGVWYTYLTRGSDTSIVIGDDGHIDLDASHILKMEVEDHNYVYIKAEIIDDVNEYVNIAGLETDVFSSSTTDNVAKVAKDFVLKDKVILKNLISGNEYKIVSTVIDPETEEVVNDLNGEPLRVVTHDVLFAPNASGEMTLFVDFPAFDSTVFEGKSVVVYQQIYWNNQAYRDIVSTDITQTRETMYFPSIKTTFTDDMGEKYIPLFGEIHLKDTVEYKSLAPGKEYTLTGTLHYIDKNGSEKELTDDRGNVVTATKTFTADSTDGSVDVTFTFNPQSASRTGAYTLVAFETLSHNDIEMCTHADIEDEAQTVKFPNIGTQIRNNNETAFVSPYDENVRLIDTVKYADIPVGNDYVLVGKLINSITGEVLKDKDGNEITSKSRFTAEGIEGTTDVVFDFNAVLLDEIIKDNEYADIIAYEYLYDDFDYDSTPVYETVDEIPYLDIYGDDVSQVKVWAVHTDKDDKDQTIAIKAPVLKTTALVGEEKVVNVSSDITVSDTISYQNLIPGREYSITGYVVLKNEPSVEKLTGYNIGYVEENKTYIDSSGEPCKVLLKEDKVVTGTMSFTPEKSEGQVVMKFSVDATGLEGKSIVVFEELYDDKMQIGIHADVNDHDQTVVFRNPDLRTGFIELTKGELVDKKSNYRTEDNGIPGYSILFSVGSAVTGGGKKIFEVAGICFIIAAAIALLVIFLINRKRILRGKMAGIIAMIVTVALVIGALTGGGFYFVRNKVVKQINGSVAEITQEPENQIDDPLPDVVITEEEAQEIKEKELKHIIVDYSYLTDSYEQTFDIPTYIEQDGIYYMFTGDSKYRDEMQLKTVIQSVKSDIRKDDETPATYTYKSPTTGKSYNLSLYDDQRSELTVIPVKVYASYTKALENGEENFPQTMDITYYDDILEADVKASGVLTSTYRTDALLEGEVTAVFKTEDTGLGVYELHNYGNVNANINSESPAYDGCKETFVKSLSLDPEKYEILDGTWTTPVYTDPTSGLSMRVGTFKYTCKTIRKTVTYEGVGEAYGYHSTAWYYIPEEEIEKNGEDYIDSSDISVLYKKVVSADYVECEVNSTILDYISERNHGVEKAPEESSEEESLEKKDSGREDETDEGVQPSEESSNEKLTETVQEDVLNEEPSEQTESKEDDDPADSKQKPSTNQDVVKPDEDDKESGKELKWPGL